jgi:hypothetical protein
VAVPRGYGVKEEEMQYDIGHCGKEGLLVSIDSYIDPWDTSDKGNIWCHCDAPTIFFARFKTSTARHIS